MRVHASFVVTPAQAVYLNAMKMSTTCRKCWTSTIPIIMKPAFWVDAMALQHCELHGPWNNHIHLTRLFLIFEKNISWDYSKTPKLSNVINNYKKNKSESLAPPPLQHRGKITTSDLLKTISTDEAVAGVKKWAKEVFHAFRHHHVLVSNIAKMYIETYHG